MSLIRFLHCINPVIITFVHFAIAYNRPYLVLHTAKPITTSIVHSQLDYCKYVYSLPKYISRMLLLELSSRLQNFHTYFYSQGWLTDLSHFSNISVPINHPISMISCLFNSAYSWSQYRFFTLCYSDQTTFITDSHSLPLPICFASSL